MENKWYIIGLVIVVAGFTLFFYNGEFNTASSPCQSITDQNGDVFTSLSDYKTTTGFSDSDFNRFVDDFAITVQNGVVVSCVDNSQKADVS